MTPCIINFASGAWYPRGQARLVQSLKDTDFKGPVLTWQNELDPTLRAPLHNFIPYGFKITAFNRAVELGFKLVLWCDAAVWAIKPLDPLFEHIEKHGYIFFASGFNCAQWTSDRCLSAMKVSRDDAEKMPMYMACCMGLNLADPRSQQFLAQLTLRANAEHFQGDWTNGHQQVSSDKRCQGHRHDQSVGSILSAQMGMTHVVGHESFFSYYNNKAGWPYQYGQQNDMTGIKDSIVLLSQGM